MAWNMKFILSIFCVLSSLIAEDLHHKFHGYPLVLSQGKPLSIIISMAIVKKATGQPQTTCQEGNRCKTLQLTPIVFSSHEYHEHLRTIFLSQPSFIH